MVRLRSACFEDRLTLVELANYDLRGTEKSRLSTDDRPCEPVQDCGEIASFAGQ